MARDRFGAVELTLQNGQKAELIGYTDDTVRLRIKKGAGHYVMTELYVTGEDSDAYVTLVPRAPVEPKIEPVSTGWKYEYFKFEDREAAFKFVAGKLAAGILASVTGPTGPDKTWGAWSQKA